MRTSWMLVVAGACLVALEVRLPRRTPNAVRAVTILAGLGLLGSGICLEMLGR